MSASSDPVSRLQPVLRLLSLPAKVRKLGGGPMVAAIVLAIIAVAVLLAPLYIPHDPVALNALNRLKGPSESNLLGTDAFGRDLFSRVMMGGRVSLFIGIGAAVTSVLIGLAIGLVSGFFRLADAIIMRIMDSLMAIPSILLAIALVALNGPSLWSVIAAITIPEIPRVVRLVRSVVLSVREEPYVEAAVALGSSMPKILWQHLMPNTLAPLTVQATYICASAILTEAILSFLGAGVSTEIPTWGNIMAEGRMHFQLKPSLIFWPGLMLSLCILSINLLGDTARDLLDPRLRKREG
ncbi:Probable D,D-dipeptide transport system permease protein ddpC [Pannonibacter phragmitetus]|uniref:Probable D,D-dipeptide transport system permease protein ddpC n=1 Tax=Pannonibacter phragmitetus TaxID=121719 RepID=A0A378ZVF8_9HYPH|nr:ABC transporter permease [Pannonibacter phragmitetus]SUB00800.1 Probable D,D-dipeptide transport system permease protein ddpC [Pannonibacter phragmitetus]